MPYSTKINKQSSTLGIFICIPHMWISIAGVPKQRYRAPSWCWCLLSVYQLSSFSLYISNHRFHIVCLSFVACCMDFIYLPKLKYEGCEHKPLPTCWLINLPANSELGNYHRCWIKKKCKCYLPGLKWLTNQMKQGKWWIWYIIHFNALFFIS